MLAFLPSANQPHKGRFMGFIKQRGRRIPLLFLKNLLSPPAPPLQKKAYHGVCLEDAKTFRHLAWKTQRIARFIYNIRNLIYPNAAPPSAAQIYPVFIGDKHPAQPSRLIIIRRVRIAHMDPFPPPIRIFDFIDNAH